MLIFSLKLDEKFFVADEITIQVIEIDKHRVRLGITAPRDIPVDRESVRLSKQAHEGK